MLGSFQVKVPADVSTDFAIVITTFPDLRSWIFRWAPGLPEDDQVIACELPRAHDAPAVGEVTEILLLTEAAGPVSTRVWDAPELVYAPTDVQLVELVQATPLRALLLLPWLGLATTAQALPFQASTRVCSTLDPLISSPTATQLVELGQDTLSRELFPAPWLGLATVDHVPPVHCSTRV